MRIQCLQHVPFEGPAAIADWAAERGHALTVTPVFEGASWPAAGAYDWLILMGGPMGVQDEADHPWLKQEKASLGEAIAAGKTIVGICLGAQLLAEALGAHVVRNRHKEVGWLPIELTEPARDLELCRGLPTQLTVFHWHGDTFTLPPGAVHLAQSAACRHQIFLHGDRRLGLQCHLEATPDSVRDLVAQGAGELVAGPYVQEAATMLAAGPEYYRPIRQVLFDLLDRLPT